MKTRLVVAVAVTASFVTDAKIALAESPADRQSLWIGALAPSPYFYSEGDDEVLDSAPSSSGLQMGGEIRYSYSVAEWFAVGLGGAYRKGVVGTYSPTAMSIPFRIELMPRIAGNVRFLADFGIGPLWASLPGQRHTWKGRGLEAQVNVGASFGLAEHLDGFATAGVALAKLNGDVGGSLTGQIPITAGVRWMF